MDTPPIPKPRSALTAQNDSLKHPVPLPRTKGAIVNVNQSSSGILHPISQEVSENVSVKATDSSKTETDTLDNSRCSRTSVDKSKFLSRTLRSSVAKSVIETTKNASLKLRMANKKPDHIGYDSDEPERCVSLPAVDVDLFDNIQFHSPLLEQKKIKIDQNHLPICKVPTPQLSASQLDGISVYSNFSDSNIDNISNFSYDSKENEQIESCINFEINTTYDTPKPSRTNSMVSVRSAMEIQKRNKKGSDIEMMRQNSLYENWTLPCVSSSKDPQISPRPSKSTIYEFDPLNISTSTNKYEGVSNELLLESFLMGDTYGNILSTDNGNDDVNYDISENEYFNPPTPPERFDSLLLNETSNNKLPQKENKSRWYDDSVAVEEPKTPNSMMHRFSTMFKLDNVLNKSNKHVTKKLEIVERPEVNNLPLLYYSGMLTKVVSGMVDDLFKNSQSRYCVLSDKKIMCYTDPSNSILKEVYLLNNITSLQLVLPLSSSTTSNSYCFELMLSSGVKCNPRKILFSCTSASERRNWAQKIADHLMNGVPTKYTSEFTRCGWCYLKEGVSGEWRGAWVVLVRRVLLYHINVDVTRTVDLRKTRCVVTQEADDQTQTSCPADGNLNLLLDCPHTTLYLRFQHDRELKGWQYMVKLAAHNNGAHIHHQQLTKDDVPTIVDKCINFIYAHGSSSEGIYRRAGSSVVLSELLARLRRDAWSVQLIPGQHSEHDVAGVLKRFFRDLPESLMPQDKHTSLTAASEIKEQAERHAEYRRIMASLPLIVQKTAKKLFTHLHFLHSMSHINKMNAENLASVWAPTIMPAALTSPTIQTAWSPKEQHVVRDLIVDYVHIWEPTETEIRREATVRSILMNVMKNATPAPPKSAGDIRVWVYIHSRPTCFQIALTPSKTSADICVELCDKAKMESHLLMLEEVICNESMRRVIHVDEIALDVVLRWGYWDEEDRKDNYLLVRENKILHDLDALRQSSSSLVCGELKLANETTKTFKSQMFEFTDGKLCCFKDKQGSHKLEEWSVKDILWYTGHEPKRNPQSRWAITVIPRNKQKRSKERPWFGCTIAGAVTEDQLKWMAALMFAEHINVMPTPRLIIT